MRWWWLVIALVLSIGMNLGLLVALALSSPALAQQQQKVMRPAALGRLPQLADRLGLEGEVRDHFIQRQRQFFAETAGPRARLPELRRQVRAELIRAHPDQKRIDELLREGSDIFLMLERSVVANVLDTRQMLPPEAEPKYVDLISRLQLEGPGQLGRLPPAQWPWWWRLRPPEPPPAGPLTPLDKDRPAQPPKPGTGAAPHAPSSAPAPR
ncbi:MAG: periplasmic heavy metal sensor [Acidobacteria bacterium]|nr:periplasmic heavy metal sensor [Acidobacteriota bacterium]